MGVANHLFLVLISRLCFYSAQNGRLYFTDRVNEPSHLAKTILRLVAIPQVSIGYTKTRKSSLVNSPGQVAYGICFGKKKTIAGRCCRLRQMRYILR